MLLNDFRAILEESGGYRLAERRPMNDLILFTLSEEKRRLNDELNGRDVLTELVDLGKHWWFYYSTLIERAGCHNKGLSAHHSMSGDEIACELITIISTELGITGRDAHIIPE